MRYLAAKALRRIERATGLTIDHAWDRRPDAYDEHPAFRFAFVTSDGQHGRWNKKTGEWAFIDLDEKHLRERTQKVSVSFEMPIATRTRAEMSGSD